MITNSAEETMQYGVELGRTLQTNEILCFYGELGAGKTTLIKGIVSGYTDHPIDEVSSPTFTYLHIYDNVFHFDLYRLKGPTQFLEMGFDEYFQAGGVCLIEWPERIADILPDHRAIRLFDEGPTTRRIDED